MFATRNRIDPALIVKGASPIRVHVPMIVVFGDSVLVIGSLVGPVLLPLLGQRSG